MRMAVACKTVIHTLILILGVVLAGGVQAAVPDNNSLLYARLAAPDAQVVLQRMGEQGSKPVDDMQTPLGSVWKLFVYAYVSDRGLPAPDYVCRGGGKLAKEELYCCDPGQHIDRDMALSLSCGLFFEPDRLQLNAADWRQYWQKKNPQIAWLADLAQLKPATMVSVSSLLQALASIEGHTRTQAESALLAVVLNGRGQGALRYLGGRYRVKTYTWDNPHVADGVMGGAAGWLSDGSAVWFGAVGSSSRVLQDYAPQLAAAAEGSGELRPGRCVDVGMFARYPLARVVDLSDGKVLSPGAAQELRGSFRVEFANGQKLLLQSNSEMQVHWPAGKRPQLSARLGESEYIARVIDREANAADREAARALSVVARTYLLQNAAQHGECLAIADSSRTQRVSPNPASAAAREIAAFTDGLVLQGVSAQYRLRADQKNILSWQHAVKQGKDGMLFDEILQKNFEHASLASVNGEAECKPLLQAERWLHTRSKRWRQVLQMEPGYAEPSPQVCQLAYGNPYSDLSRQRIFVRGLSSLNHRITLAHEYLHLAFAAYPSGQDENYIERWARRLIEGDFPS